MRKQHRQPTWGPPLGALASTLVLLALHMPIHAALAAREGAFHGYSEKSQPRSTSPADPASSALHPPPQTPSSGHPASLNITICRDHNSACADWAKKGECQSNPQFMQEKCPAACKLCEPSKVDPMAHRDQLLVLHTSKGDIRIRPMWSNAPRTAALIMDLAAQAADQKTACRFYRNEAVPVNSEGPPYGLFQGSLAGMLEAPPMEGTAPPVRGMTAMITGTTEFYIALMDHTSWGTAHVVWGQVEDMHIVDNIVNTSPYRNFTHPSYGTVMRMMLTDLPFMPLLQPLPTEQDAAAEL